MSGRREALILAGGFGTRLRSVLHDRPKPMAEVAGKPFLEWLLLKAAREGVKRFILCTGYLGDVVFSHFGDGSLWGLEIVYSREESALGTAGALCLAEPLLREETVLVLNGDSYCEYDATILLEAHRRLRSAATIWLVEVADSDRYGSVSLRADGSVESFREKGAGGGRGLINAGVYALNRRLIRSIPAGRSVSLEKETFPGLVGHGLHGVVGSGSFIDIGTPESFQKAGEFLQANSVPEGGATP